MIYLKEKYLYLSLSCIFLYSNVGDTYALLMKTDSLLYGLFKLGGKIMPCFETVLVWAKLKSFKMSDD